MNDRKHGIGKMSFADGDVYNGQWFCGLMHGTYVVTSHVTVTVLTVT